MPKIVRYSTRLGLKKKEMRDVRRIYVYHKVHPRAVSQQRLKEKAPDPLKFLGFRTDRVCSYLL